LQFNGQDDNLLARLLLVENYDVWGTSRVAQGSSFTNVSKQGIKDRVNFLSMVPEDFRSVLVTLRKGKPDELYYLQDNHR